MMVMVLANWRRFETEGWLTAGLAPGPGPVLGVPSTSLSLRRILARWAAVATDEFDKRGGWMRECMLWVRRCVGKRAKGHRHGRKVRGRVWRAEVEVGVSSGG